MITDHEIGGAVTQRRFTNAGTVLPVGARMTREDVMAIPASNRRALALNGFIAVHPRGDASAPTSDKRHIVHNGGGRFDVIAGHKLNDAPMTKEEAEELAARS